MALTYKGNWALNTQYYVDDYVTDASDDSGEGAGTLLYCIVNNLSSSTVLADDWDASYWSTRSGTNSYYNNSVTDGGPQLVEGTLAKATEVENKFTAVAKGFDEFQASSGNPLSLTASDYTASGRILDDLIAERANKAIGFDANGDVVSVALKGEYKGDWTTATIYALGDTVKDTTNVFGSGIDSIIVAITAHTSTGVGDASYWETWVDTGSLQTLADEAAVSAAAALVSENNAETAETNAETAETNAELSEWEAEAARQTSDNYAITAEDTFVSTVASDGDGTYTSTPTTDYSALHWAAKAAASAAGGVATVVGGTNISVDSSDVNNPIVSVTGKVADSELLDGIPLGVYQTTHWDEVVTTDFLGNTDVGKVMAFYDKNVDTDENAWFMSHQGTEFSISNWSGTGKLRIRADGTVQMSSNDPVFDDEVCNKGYVDGSSSKATNGYVKFPNGVIIQWGTNTFPSGGGTISFPITFPTACMSVTTGLSNSYFGDTAAIISADFYTTTGFSGYGKYYDGTNWADTGILGTWQAMGY